MKMNGVEKFLMNSPVRAWIQCRFEAPLLERIGGRVPGGRVLEIGCGRGVGTKLILERFGASHVDAVDVDEEMVCRARRYLAAYSPARVRINVANVTEIEAAEHAYDAVFDFAILHHVPRWQQAVSEIRRVLKPGGKLYFHEVTAQALGKWFLRTFLEHPTDNRFSSEQFVVELERQGFVFDAGPVAKGGGDYVYGVARRQ